MIIRLGLVWFGSWLLCLVSYGSSTVSGEVHCNDLLSWDRKVAVGDGKEELVLQFGSKTIELD